MGYIKKLKNNELVGGTDKTTIYPVTSTKAVFEEVTEGDKSSSKSQETINKEQQDELDDHEGRIQAAEAEDIKSITINGSTKEFRVDDNNNVDLTIYTVDNDPEMPSIASNVEDLRNMVGTSTPVLETSHKTRIETLEGGESIAGSVENKIKTKIDSINNSYQDDNNEYVKYSMTQTSGKVTNFNIDETSLKNAIISLNTSISGDNIVIRSGSTPSGTGEAGKIYRYVNSSNNTYTDYMYSGGSWVTLAIHDTSDEQAQVAYYTCTATGSGAQATKQFVSNGSLEYTPSSGGHIKILMGEANAATGTIYLQFGTTTSTKKPLYYNGEPASASNTWEENEVISVYYDGTYYQASNAQGGGGKAQKIKYDNSQSGLAAENVQDALDETDALKIGSKELSLQEYTGNKFLGIQTGYKINDTGEIVTSSTSGHAIRWGQGLCYKDDYIDFIGKPDSQGGKVITLGFVEDDPGEMTTEELLTTNVSNITKISMTASTVGTARIRVPYNGYFIYFLNTKNWDIAPTWTFHKSNLVYNIVNGLDENVPGKSLDATQGKILREKFAVYRNVGYDFLTKRGIGTDDVIATTGSDTFNLGYLAVSKGDTYQFHYSQSSALNGILIIAMTSELPATGVTVTDRVDYQVEEGTFLYVAPYNGYMVFRYNTSHFTTFDVRKESADFDGNKYYKDTQTWHTYTGSGGYGISTANDATFGEAVAFSSANNYWGGTKFIYIKGCKYIEMAYHRSGGSAIAGKGAVFYDKDKLPISVAERIIFSPAITDNGTTNIIKVPDNAYYIRVTGNPPDTIEKTISINLYKENSVFNTRAKAIEYILNQAKYVDYDNNLANQHFVQKQSLTILHYTDIHAETRAAEFIKDIIDALGDKLDDVLCTGDVVYANYDSTTTKDSESMGTAATYGYVWWQNSGLAEKSLFTIGNHEGNKRDGSSPYKESSTKPNDWDNVGKQVECETFIEPYAEGLGITRPDGVDDSESPDYKAMYWYKDYADQKIRLIGIDGIHHYDNVRYTTREQEDWLEDTLAATPSDYSVIFACHFGLDDFYGHNIYWDDEEHKWICNENATGGIVMKDVDTVAKFHDRGINGYTCNAQMALRVKYIPSGGTYGQRVNTDENPIGDIIQDWIDGGGKCVAWIGGHTHTDYMFYPTKYPSILNIVNTCARSAWETNMGTTLDTSVTPSVHYSPVNLATGTFEDYCANIYVFDTQNGFVKIIRVGRSMDKYLIKKDYLCYDYVNKKVISEG